MVSNIFGQKIGYIWLESRFQVNEKFEICSVMNCIFFNISVGNYNDENIVFVIFLCLYEFVKIIVIKLDLIMYDKCIQRNG